jgi:hypothetical protein
VAVVPTFTQESPFDEFVSTQPGIKRLAVVGRVPPAKVPVRANPSDSRSTIMLVPAMDVGIILGLSY